MYDDFVHLSGKKHDAEKNVKTTGVNERSFIKVDQGTGSEDSEEESSEPVEMGYISGLPVSCTFEISSPEHGRSYSPISSVGSCDFDVVEGFGDSDNVLSGLSTVSEYLNTADELNSPSSLVSYTNELKSERREVDGGKLASDADWSRDGYSSSERGSLNEKGKENTSDVRSRLPRHSSKVTGGKSEQSIACTSSPGRMRDEHRGVPLDDSRYRRSKKRSTSRESSRPNKERSPDRYRSSLGRRDDGSRSKSSKSKSRSEQTKPVHHSATKHSSSSRHSRQHKRSPERGSRDRSRDRSPDTESRSRRKRRSRSSSIRTNSRKARSRSNSSMSSNSSKEGDHGRRKRRSRLSNQGKKRKIDLSDEVLLGKLNSLSVHHALAWVSHLPFEQRKTTCCTIYRWLYVTRDNGHM